MAASAPRKILVTSALPYANGSLHLGHLLEQVQTDIWVRFQKSRGHHCIYICADDAHGTAIMLTAERLGISTEQQIDNIKQEHLRDSTGFLIDFDNFHTTHSEENRFWCEAIYQQLKKTTISPLGRLRRPSIRKNSYFSLTALLKALAHAAKLRISTVITVKPVGPPTARWN